MVAPTSKRLDLRRARAEAMAAVDRRVDERRKRVRAHAGEAVTAIAQAEQLHAEAANHVLALINDEGETLDSVASYLGIDRARVRALLRLAQAAAPNPRPAPDDTTPTTHEQPARPPVTPAESE